jgi:hypothetical protein
VSSNQDPSSTSRPPRSQKTKSPPGPETTEAPPPLFQGQDQLPPRPAPPLDDLAGPPSASAWPPDEMPDLPPTTASGSSPEFSAGDRKQLKETLRRGLKAFGQLLNRVATVDELEEQAGLYALDDDDTEGIADPAAGIIGRRGGLAQAANPDINDAIRAAIALALYVSKQLSLRRDIRRARGDQPPAVEQEHAA